MGVVVQKYGGTSVADPEKIRAVAERVVSTRKAGSDVVVVVSAMGATTDDLLDLAHQVAAQPSPREMDMLLTAGERISIALLCMALIDLGYEAVSFTGSQAGIVTDTIHGKARILEVKGSRIRAALAEGKIVAVAGFQGVSTSSDITTLGRGGSDTSAVAVAASLEADVCEIYTDVDGVYTADPRSVPSARKLDAITYEEMLELSASGAKVLQVRSVEYARNHGVPIHVRSSFTQAPGTWVVEEAELMEQAIISGVAHDASEAKMTIKAVPDHPGVAARIFTALAGEAINVDMIVQNVSSHGHTDVSFTLPRGDLPTAQPVIESPCAELGAEGFDTEHDIAKVSLVGAGMKTHPGVAAQMFTALARAGVNIEMISTSTIRVSCVIKETDLDRALVAVHDSFRLGEAAPS
ncbi:MAG: aspartate kinase [Actinobacteria bacterium ATB1]|nr:aspartate kinase [Actinobacteria bacterium ATB1]